MSTKNWDNHVLHAEEVARGDGFRALRDRIVDLASPNATDIAVDVGAGTGLLSLALAERVSSVWAIDISPAMTEYLRVKAASAGLGNLHVAVASAASLPLVDQSADLVVSNYCLHHLANPDKQRALGEAFRVLRPGGRLACGDMMFQVSLADQRDREVLGQKVRAMVRRGPRGLLRLVKNGVRYAGRRWEHPARAEWWEAQLRAAGFVDVRVQLLDHEGGLATARRPRPTP